MPLRAECDVDRRTILFDIGNPAAELESVIRIFAQLLVQHAGELRLLALQAERVPRDIRNGGEIELSDEAVADAVLELRRDQALGDQGLRGAEFVEHVERRRMESRGARFLAEAGASLEHRHRNALPHQIGRGRKPDRAGAGDEDALFGRPSFNWHKLIRSEAADLSRRRKSLS